MSIKNLGHYIGEVEDIEMGSLKYKCLDSRHQELIFLSKEREKINQRLTEIEEQISSIKESIKDDIKSGSIKWGWIWMKKQTRVKWKEEFIKFLGTKKANEVKSKYEQKEYEQIGIQYVDSLPENIIQIKSNDNIPKKQKLKVKK